MTVPPTYIKLITFPPAGFQRISILVLVEFTDFQAPRWTRHHEPNEALQDTTPVIIVDCRIITKRTMHYIDINVEMNSNKDVMVS